MDKCVFCKIGKVINPSRIVFQTTEWIAIYDNYPVSKGHTLLIPKGHYETYFDLPDSLRENMHYRLDDIKKILDEKFHPNGYNIGCNCGEASGQTVPHFHMHIIPRYYGDIDNPRGGVRGVIPAKQNYE